MPIRPAISRTAGPLPSFVPVTSKEGSSFVFWDAIQWSNAIYGFSGLAFERFLGEGAQFKVDLYRNPEKDSDMPELVAVKTAKMETVSIPDDPDQEEAVPIHGESGIRKRTYDLYSFVQEIHVLSHTPLQSHPSIMRLLGSSWTTDVFGTPIPQLIVEYSSLGNLFDMLATSPPLTTREKLDIVFDISSGLERIHECGIAHGDMKLSNIMVFPSERPACRFTGKISDFGSSIAADDAEERKIYRGSPGYCPPDALTERTMSMADLQTCDIFALGLCTWEILNDGRPFFEPDQEQIPSGRHVPATYPFLVRVDAFLNSIPLVLERRQTGGARFPGHDTTPDGVKLCVLEPLKSLLRGQLDPIRSLRWSSKDVVRYMVSNHFTSHTTGPLEQPVPGVMHNFMFQRPSVGIFTASDNRIPRGAQRQSVKDLQELWPSLKGAERCQALVMISDCFAHGYGTCVDFRECLRYLHLAAENRESGAMDAVLLPISAAILGETEHDLLQSVGIKRAIRPALTSFEEGLCRYPHHERYYRRWLQWVDITHGMLAQSHITIEDSDGSIYVLDLDDEVKRDRCILGDIKSPIGAIARQQDTLGDSNPGAMPLLQLAASMDWRGLLQKLHARDAKMFHHLYGSEDFPPEVANFGSMLLTAMAHGRSHLVRFLVQEVGVSVKVQPNCTGLPASIGPLHLSFNIPDNDLRDTISLLIDHGADVNIKNPAGVTLSTLPGHFPLEISGPPLDVAISLGRLGLVKILLERGANPLLECEETMVKRPHNPLQLAVALHVHEIVDVILDSLTITMAENDSLPRKDTRDLMRHLAGEILGGKGLFWKWLLHGSRYREACQQTIEVCLKHGLDINGTVNENGDTPLIFAAVQNPCHGYVLETLLDYGANTDIQNTKGHFAVSLCLNSAWDSVDYSHCLKALIGAGANVHLAISNGQQPIHLHAAANMKECVNLLLDAGADVEARSQEDETPLIIAVCNDAYTCVETLLDRNADINALVQLPSVRTPVTALSFAADMGNIRMFRLLTKRGAVPCPPMPLNSGAPPASSALHHAAYAGRAEILRVALREFPAIYRTPELLSQLSSSGYTPLYLAAARAYLGCVRELVLAGAPLETRDPSIDLEFGCTPLGASIQGGAFQISRFLLQSGAWPWVRGPPGGRWWSFLCEGLFLARIEPEGQGKVAVLLEETWKWVEEWDLLRVRDFGGRTILHMAVYYGLVDVVKMLVERGASVHDQTGEPMQDMTWEAADLSGLDCWGLAQVMRRLSPEEREELYDPDSVTIPDEDMEEVVRYLEGFEWPVTVIDEQTDSEDDLESDVSKAGSELNWDDTSNQDRESEGVGADEDDEEAGAGTSNIEGLESVAESPEIAETEPS